MKVKSKQIHCPNCGSHFVTATFAWDYPAHTDEELKCLRCKTLFSARIKRFKDEYEILAMKKHSIE
jgi:DNA-directed RNA polymerase subunit RPC12/RpoP